MSEPQHIDQLLTTIQTTAEPWRKMMTAVQTLLDDPQLVGDLPLGVPVRGARSLPVFREMLEGIQARALAVALLGLDLSDQTLSLVVAGR